MIGKEFGQFIALERKRKGYTQNDLAKILKVTDRAVSNWERGTNYPDITMLTSLAEVLDVSVIELLKGQRMDSDELIAKEEVNDYVAESLAYTKQVSRQRFKMTLGKATILMILFLFMSYGFVSTFFPTALLNYNGWKTVKIDQMGTIKVPESWFIDQEDGFWIATDKPLSDPDHRVFVSEITQGNRWYGSYDSMKIKAPYKQWDHLFWYSKNERYGNLSALWTNYADPEWTIPRYILNLYG
jgi:transcriptional regulator with XRE-family HTH domain